MNRNVVIASVVVLLVALLAAGLIILDEPSDSSKISNTTPTPAAHARASATSA